MIRWLNDWLERRVYFAAHEVLARVARQLAADLRSDPSIDAFKCEGREVSAADYRAVLATVFKALRADLDRISGMQFQAHSGGGDQ